ncbi:MAG: hypothetical protein ACXWXL_05905, partial [Candidatus Binatia bacterium]
LPGDMFLRQICDIEGYSRTNLVHVCHLIRQSDRFFPVMLGLILRVTAPNLQVTASVRLLIGVSMSVTERRHGSS